MVLVTHENDIAAYTKRIVRFLDGKIVVDDKIEQNVIHKEVVAS